MVKIYVLLHPITKEIRYVGKTTEALNRRLCKHVYARNGTSKISKWIGKLHKQDLRPIIELLTECSKDKWQSIEKYWIAEFQSLGYNLMNTAPGGESGCMGYKHTEEAKKRISKLNSRPKSKKWIKNATNATRKATAVPILQFDLDGNFIKEFDSFSYAAMTLSDYSYNTVIKNIHSCCNNLRKTAYGFKWEYK